MKTEETSYFPFYCRSNRIIYVKHWQLWKLAKTTQMRTWKLFYSTDYRPPSHVFGSASVTDKIMEKLHGGKQGDFQYSLIGNYWYWGVRAWLTGNRTSMWLYRGDIWLSPVDSKLKMGEKLGEIGAVINQVLADFELIVSGVTVWWSGLIVSDRNSSSWAGCCQWKADFLDWLLQIVGQSSIFIYGLAIVWFYIELLTAQLIFKASLE